MPFIGKNPTAGFSTIVKNDLTPDGSTTAFTLSKNVASANDIAVFVGNVRQEPTDAYTVSGATLTMSVAPATGINFYVMHIAGTLESSVVPAAGTTVPGAFGVSGALTTSTLAVSGNATVSGALDVNATATLGGGTDEIQIVGGSGTARVDAIGGNTNVNLSLSTKGTGKVYFWRGGYGSTQMALLDSDGLKFGSDTAAANALDDYEEGTFTMTYNAGTITGQSGLYTKIGRLVTAHFQISWTAAGTSLGIIGGLPFNVVTTNYGGTHSREWYSTGTSIQCVLSVGTPSLNLFWYNNTRAVTNGNQYGVSGTVVYNTA